MMSVQTESNELGFCLCMGVKAIIPVGVHRSPWPVFLMTFGATQPKELATKVGCSSGEWRAFAL